MRATAEVTAASVDNLKLIRDSRADIAFTLADTLDDAVKGRARSTGVPVPAASLAVLDLNYTQIVTLASLGHPARRRPSRPHGVHWSPGSGTEVHGAPPAGRPPGSTRRRTSRDKGSAPRNPRTRSRTGRSTRSSGAAGYRPRRSRTSRTRRESPSGLVPRPILPALARSRRSSTSSCDPVTGSIRVRVDVPVVGVANVLVVNRAMSDDLAYDITRPCSSARPSSRRSTLKRAISR